MSRRLLRRLGLAYVTLCAGLAILANIYTGGTPIWFIVLAFATFPLSPAGIAAQYFGGILLFGPEQSGFTPGLASVTFWTIIACAEAVFIGAVVERMRRE